MTVNFYNNSSDNDDVKKSISAIANKDCKIYGDCSIQSPTLLVNMADGLINANYCYIPKFGRYYYITDINISDGTIAMVRCKVDVLMSFWNDFRNSQCIARRSSSRYDNYIDDPLVVKRPTSQYVFRKLPTKFTPSDSAGSYILTLGGGN